VSQDWRSSRYAFWAAINAYCCILTWLQPAPPIARHPRHVYGILTIVWWGVVPLRAVTVPSTPAALTWVLLPNLLIGMMCTHGKMSNVSRCPSLANRSSFIVEERLYATSTLIPTITINGAVEIGAGPQLLQLHTLDRLRIFHCK
jgi:hypothetical protein